MTRLAAAVGALAVTFGVVACDGPRVPPAPPRSEGVSFGVATGSGITSFSDADLARYMESIASLGAQYVRTDVPMPHVFSSGLSDPDWSQFDRVVDAAKERGLDVLATILDAPAWGRDPAYGARSQHAPWASTADLENAARQVISRYYPQGIRVYEVWNEPNVAGFFGVTGRNVDDRDVRKYAAMVKAVHAAAKSVATDTVVVAGTAGIGYYPGGPYQGSAPSMGSLHYLEKLYDPAVGNWKGSFDALAYHAYPDFLSEQRNDPSAALRYDGIGEAWCGWFTLDETTPSARSIMVENGDGDKRIWATEIGGATTPDGSHWTETAQAAIIPRLAADWSRKPYSGGFMLYTAKDSGASATDHEQNFGLLRADWSRKPAWQAYRDAIAG